jgi:hypothetical protein
MRKYLSLALVLLFTWTTTSVPAYSAVKIGSACKSVGKKTTLNGSTLICTKSGSKLVWSKSSKADSYDAAFANAFLAEAKRNAAKILEEAQSTANQISSPPYCSTSNSRAFASIGSDQSTGLRALVFENPGICDISVRASAAFRCDSPLPPSRNTVTGTGVFPLRAKEKLIVSYNITRFFPQVLTDCRLLTGISSNLVNISGDGQQPSVMTLTSNYSGNFNQYEASKKAEQIIQSAKVRADKIIADAKNPALIAKAWKDSEPTRVTAAKSASDRKAQDAGLGKKCVVGVSCLIGSTGPGGGIVFYDAGSQQSWGRYLEFAPPGWNGTSEDPVQRWCPLENLRTKFADGVTDPNRKQTLGLEIGKGKGNSLLAAENCNPGAAALAMGYAGGGKNDWFLPSRDELNELCKYAYGQATGNSKVICSADVRNADSGYKSTKELRPGFGRYYYWSSSEGENVDMSGYTGSTAWAKTFDFDEPFRGDIGKNYDFYVRPIRAF